MLGALVECFHSKMNTFYLPLGELTVTLEDIYKIFLIPFHRPCIEYDIKLQVGAVTLIAILQDNLVLS